jgi:hypothetical protein
LRKSAFIVSLGVLALLASGCSTSGETANISGKVQTAPLVGVFGDEGFACVGPEFSLGFSGQQIKLLDSSGEVVGITNLEGWPGDPNVDLEPGKQGYNDQGMCSWDFNFAGVSVESDFYTIEFSDQRIIPPSITKEELLNGPVIPLG